MSKDGRRAFYETWSCEIAAVNADGVYAKTGNTPSVIEYRGDQPPMSIADFIPASEPDPQAWLQRTPSFVAAHYDVGSDAVTTQSVRANRLTIETRRRETDLHRVQYAAFCQQWIAIAFAALIGRE